MSPWLPVLSPVVATALNCLVYLVLKRAFKLGLTASIFGGLGIGLAAITIFAVSTLYDFTAEPAALLLSQIGTYLGLAFCFWAFLNLNITSLRIRMIRQLLDAGGAMTMAGLMNTYSDSERLQRRLRRLQETGQIVLVEGKWQIRSSPMLAIARCVDVLRIIMGQNSDISRG